MSNVEYSMLRYLPDLLFSLLEDGASISTLVRKCKGINRSILVIQDTEGVVFGCILCDDEWKVSYDQKYYGSGTVRVFTFKSGKPEVSLPTVV